MSAIEVFDQIQIGPETTNGTLVAALAVLAGRGEYEEGIERYYDDYPDNKRARAGGVGTIVGKGSRLTFSGDLTPEELVWFLLSSVDGSVEPTGESAPFTWAFAPDLDVSAPSIATNTYEIIRSDGSSNLVAHEFGYGFVESLSLSWAANDVAKLQAVIMGRARQTTTPTASLTRMPGRTTLPTALASVFADTSWAGLGGTQLSSSVRSAQVELIPGLTAEARMDGRADMDFSEIIATAVGGSFQLVMDLDAVGAARTTAWRAGTRQFIRLLSPDASGDHSVQVDLCGVIEGEPSESVTNGIKTLTVDGVIDYDPTGDKAWEVTLETEEDETGYTAA